MNANPRKHTGNPQRVPVCGYSIMRFLPNTESSERMSVLPDLYPKGPGMGGRVSAYEALIVDQPP
jgi:hypothetical protein